MFSVFSVSSLVIHQSKATDSALSFNTTVSSKISNVVKLVIPKTVNLTAKIVPLIEPRPKKISVPAETNKFQLFSQNCQSNGFLNVPDLVHDSQKVNLITLPAAKVVRPPVALLSTHNSIFTKIQRCRPTKFYQNVRSIRPKVTPRLVNKCRLCGSLEKEMLEIFDPCGMQKKIIDKISTLLPFKVLVFRVINLFVFNPPTFLLFKVEPSDMLPSRICVKCKSSLDSAYDFYITCVEVDLSLKIQLEAEDSENVSVAQKASLYS